jgi:hypothetical protein
MFASGLATSPRRLPTRAKPLTPPPYGDSELCLGRITGERIALACSVHVTVPSVIDSPGDAGHARPLDLLVCAVVFLTVRPTPDATAQRA